MLFLCLCYVSLWIQRKKISSECILGDTAELKSLNTITRPLQDFTELLQLTLRFCAVVFWKITEQIERL